MWVGEGQVVTRVRPMISSNPLYLATCQYWCSTYYPDLGNPAWADGVRWWLVTHIWQELPPSQAPTRVAKVVSPIQPGQLNKIGFIWIQDLWERGSSIQCWKHCGEVELVNWFIAGLSEKSNKDAWRRGYKMRNIQRAPDYSIDLFCMISHCLS